MAKHEYHDGVQEHPSSYYKATAEVLRPKGINLDLIEKIVDRRKLLDFCIGLEGAKDPCLKNSGMFESRTHEEFGPIVELDLKQSKGKNYVIIYTFPASEMIRVQHAYGDDRQAFAGFLKEIQEKLGIDYQSFRDPKYAQFHGVDFSKL